MGAISSGSISTRSASTVRGGTIKPPHSSFFTHGLDPHAYRLPHPPFGLPVILVVRQAITRAFEILKARSDCPIGTASEDAITIALRAVLENVLRQTGEVGGFSRETFEKVERQHRVTNHDGVLISKEPDMKFTIRDDRGSDVISTEDGLFVECKPVDGKHAPGTHYCDRGIQRFVDGDYAWAMQEAMMLGYVRGGRTIARDLLPAMQKESRRQKLKTMALPRPVPEKERSEQTTDDPLHSSRHRRGFSWRDGKGDACPITVYHSWHVCE